ncbi:MAG: excinuclease ABC subunit UvrC [Opitutales bacterium]
MPTSDLKEKIRHLPQGPGVYLMKDRLGSLLYVGKAKNLRKRVASYFRKGKHYEGGQAKIASMVRLIYDVDVIEVKNEAEALLLEGRLIKEWKPKYNTLFVDDKRFLLIRVDVDSLFPQFRLVRNRRDDGALYFGPFPDSAYVRKTLNALRTKFGILLGDTRPQKQETGVFKLYEDFRSEIYGHPNELSAEAYQDRVTKACAFLQGEVQTWLQSLKHDMERASESKQYEKAARLRDIIDALEDTLRLQSSRKFTRANTPMDDADAGIVALKESLQLESLPRYIECFDISHISGSFVVASMVCFFDGMPQKKQYRRYKIRSFEGNDDYRSMEEVVGRRYRRLHEEGKPLPDLILIDGGRGQVHAALKSFFVLDIPCPPIVGLAKREEALVLPDRKDLLKLSRRHPGLRLLQRLRDEAHRFANTYNADLRSQKIRESLLDDIPGLGSTRKELLFKEFNSMTALKQASLDALMRSPGIGPKLAQAIYEKLRNFRNKDDGSSS